MANIVPIPTNLPSNGSLGALTPGSPVSGASGGVRTSPVLRYLSALRRAKWLVLLLTAAGVGAGVVIARLKPPSYVVHGSLQLSPDEASAFVGAQYTDYIQTYTMIEIGRASCRERV